MIQSNYAVGDDDGTESAEDLKKKLLLKKPVLPTDPDVSDIDTELGGNKIALTKNQVDNSNDYQANKSSNVVGSTYADDTKTNALKDASSTGQSLASGNAVGAGVMAGASGALDMAITAKANEGLLTGKERKANTMQMAAKGASTGAAIGSVIPGVGTLIGGAAGAVIGGATGYLSHMGDEKKLRKKNKEAEAIAYQKQVTDREEAQKLYDAGEQVQAKKNILKSQMGILGSNYNSKNV